MVSMNRPMYMSNLREYVAHDDEWYDIWVCVEDQREYGVVSPSVYR